MEYAHISAFLSWDFKIKTENMVDFYKRIYANDLTKIVKWDIIIIHVKYSKFFGGNL